MRWNTLANILANLAIPFSSVEWLAPSPAVRRRRAARTAGRSIYLDALEYRQLLSGSPPTVTDFTKALDQNSILAFTAADFTSNYSDPDSDPLASIQIQAVPTQGTLTLTQGVNVTVLTNGAVVQAADLGGLAYQPDAGSVGTDTFTWQANDGTQPSTNTATTTLDVEQPVITSFSKTTTVNNAGVFAPSDFSGNYTGLFAIANITMLTLPTNGSLELSGNAVVANQTIDVAQLGNLSYVPNLNFSGGDVFTWSASDGTASSVSAAVNISVVTETPPTVTDFSETVDQNSILSFTANDFTSNYSDPNNYPLVSVEIENVPTSGTLTLTQGVNVTVITPDTFVQLSDLNGLAYQPDAGTVGTDTFTWAGFNGTLSSVSFATTTLDIVQPTISGFSKTTLVNNPVSFAATDFTNTYSGLFPIQSITVLTLPADGTLELSGNNVVANQIINVNQLDNLTLTPAAGFVGNDSFTWLASDGSASSVSATVGITVGSDLTSSTQSTFANVPITFQGSDVTGLYSGPGSVQSVTIATLPTNGTLSLTMNSSTIAVTANQVIALSDLSGLTFTPDAGFTGNDSFTWTVSNGTVSSETEAVSLVVNADFTGVSETLLQNSNFTFSTSDVTNGYSGPNTVQSVDIVTLPTNGTLQLFENGSSSTVVANQTISVAEVADLVYTPTTNFVGSDSFTWSASDGNFPSNATTVSLTVNPLLVPFSKSIDKGTTLTFTAGDFSGAFAISLESVKFLRLPTKGTLALTVAGVTHNVTSNQVIPLAELGGLTYKPPATFTGSDSILWTASSDGIHFVTPPSTISISVNALSLANFSIGVGENTPLDFDGSDFITNFSGGGTLTTVKIASLPAHGTLTLANGTSSTAIVANQTLSTVDLGNLVYTPAANFVGNDTFTWTGADGGLFVSPVASVTLAVNNLSIMGSSTDTTGTLITNGESSPSFAQLTDFGGTGLPNASGPALTRTYVITNVTSETINFTDTVNPIHLSLGTTSGFSVTTQPSVTTLNPGDTASFVVTFSPLALGQSSVNVLVGTDDPGLPQFKFEIQGTGLLASQVGTNSGLLSATTVAGTGNGAFNGEVVHISYTGRLLDGSIFDASDLHGNVPLTFRLDNTADASFVSNSTTNQFIAPSEEGNTITTVISGWEDAIQGMKVGQHMTLIIPSAFGYGADGSGTQGQPGFIPGGATLVFDIVMNAIDGSPSLGVTNFQTLDAILPGNAPNAADGTDFGTLAPGQTLSTSDFLGTNNSPTTSAGVPLGQIHQTGPIKIIGANPSDFIVTGSLFNGFSITFKPNAPGVRTATFTVATDDPLHKNFTFGLRGDSVAFNDLVVSSVGTAVFPTLTNTNNDFTTTIPVVIANIGNQPVPSVTPDTDVQISIQDTTNTSNAPIVIGTISSLNISGLAVNGKRTVNVPVTIPGGLTLSTYDFVATVNSAGGVAESISTNNSLTINSNISGSLVSTTIPSLIVDNSTANSAALVDIKGNVVVQVKNSGTLAFPTNEKVEITIQAVNGTNSAITLATGSTFSVASLKTGATMNFTLPVNFAAGLTDGSYNLQAVLALSPRAFETSITDNTVTTDSSGNSLTIVSAPAAPDLTIAFGTGQTAVSGGPNGFHSSIPVVITNAGNITVPNNGSSSTDVTVFIQNVNDTTSSFEVGSLTHVNFAGLQATKTKPVSVPISVNGTIPAGDYVYEIEVNGSNDLVESDTTNDAATSSMNISGTLVSSSLPGSISHTAKPTPGVVAVQLTNAGEMQIPAGLSVTLKLVLHNVDSGVDTVITTVTHHISSAKWHKVGGTASFNLNVKVPKDLPAGNYIIEAQLVDAPPIIESSIEDNIVTETQFSTNIPLTIT